MQFIKARISHGGLILGVKASSICMPRARPYRDARRLASGGDEGRPLPHQRHRDPISGQQDRAESSASLSCGATSRIDGISDLRDESDSARHEFDHRAQARRAAAHRAESTAQVHAAASTFGAQMLALVDGQPRLLSLKRALQIYIAHRHQVITRRSQFDLDKARARAHILEGLRIALANLDAVIQTIRQSPNAEEARTRLIDRST